MNIIGSFKTVRGEEKFLPFVGEIRGVNTTNPKKPCIVTRSEEGKTRIFYFDQEKTKLEKIEKIQGTIVKISPDGIITV